MDEKDNRLTPAFAIKVIGGTYTLWSSLSYTEDGQRSSRNIGRHFLFLQCIPLLVVLPFRSQ
jgi:hypothetical protein